MRRLGAAALAALLALAACRPREVDPNEAARAKAAEATVLERDGDWTGAIGSWNAARAADPASPFAAIEAGRLFARMGLYADAVAAFEEAATRAPKSPRPHLQLAALYRSAGRDELAARAIEAAASIAPSDPEILIERGRVNLDREIWKAASDLGAAMRARPEDPEAYILLGRLERRRHAYGEAEAVLKRAIEKAPHNLDARLELAGLLRELERSGEALRLLEPELEGPLPAAALAELVTLYEKVDRPQDAGRYRERLAEMQAAGAALAAPREALWRRAADLDARRAVGALLLRLGRAREAEGIFRGWVYYEPASAEAWEGVASACLAGRDAAAARRALERAVTGAKDDVATLARLAELFRGAGDESRASALLAELPAPSPSPSPGPDATPLP